MDTSEANDKHIQSEAFLAFLRSFVTSYKFRKSQEMSKGQLNELTGAQRAQASEDAVAQISS